MKNITMYSNRCHIPNQQLAVTNNKSTEPLKRDDKHPVNFTLEPHPSPQEFDSIFLIAWNMTVRSIVMFVLYIYITLQISAQNFSKTKFIG